VTARLLAVALATLAVAACGGDEAPDFAAVKAKQLAIMPLPPRDLGGLVRGLVVDAEESGYLNNVDAAEDTLDPFDTPDDLFQAGRRNGYALGYFDDDLSSLRSGAGVVSVVSGVDLFTTPERARTYLQKELDDYRRFDGEQVDEGVELSDVEVRKLDDLGEGAWLVRATATVEGAAIHATFAAFTHDRVMGGASIIRADREPMWKRAEELGRALYERIDGVARGELDEKPVPIVDADRQSTGDPADAEKLARLALSLDDLPRGVRVVREGVVADNTFEREFEPGDVVFGRSRLLELETRVELRSAQAETAAQLNVLRTVLGGRRGQEFVKEAFAEQSGTNPTDVRVREIPSSIEGGSLVVRGEVRTRAGSFVTYLGFVRVDRAIGSLFVAGRKQDLRDADMLALAETFGARIATGLGAA
jgi:hypothetical protein